MLNFGKFLNKKVIVLVFVILFLVGGGIFWWNTNIRETPTDKWIEAKMSRGEDYKIKETANGKFVENEKMGLMFKIPDDWVIENDSPSMFYTSDMELSEERSDILKKGCRVNVYGGYIKTNLATLEKFINEDFTKLSSVIKVDQSSKTELSNYPALRYEYNAESLEMIYISVNLPFQNKLYKILLSSSVQDGQHCKAEFDKFLETVSIQPQ